MLSLNWNHIGRDVTYPKKNFIPLHRLRSIVGKNSIKYEEYLERTTLFLEDNFILIQLLKHFDIEDDMDVLEMVNYIKLRSYSLTSMFGIASMSNRGRVITNGVMGDNFEEIWVSYEDGGSDGSFIKSMDELTPIKLLWKSDNERNYISRAQRKNYVSNSNVPMRAVIAIDLVELVLGWVMFRRNPDNAGLGISTYLIRGPLKNFTLMCNEWCIFNSLCLAINESTPICETIEFKGNVFATLDENKLIREYVEHLINVYEGRIPNNIGDVLYQIDRVGRFDKSNIINTNLNGIISQYSWVNEIVNMQYLTLYLKVCNIHGIKASDVNTMITRNSVIIANNFKKIPDKGFRKLYLGKLEHLNVINNLNYR